MKRFFAILIGVVVVGVIIYAAPLIYTPPEPQTGDSELVISHKTAVNISTIADYMVRLVACQCSPTPTPTATATATP
jgi:hypothetical protein